MKLLRSINLVSHKELLRQNIEHYQSELVKLRQTKMSLIDLRAYYYKHIKESILTREVSTRELRDRFNDITIELIEIEFQIDEVELNYLNNVKWLKYCPA